MQRQMIKPIRNIHTETDGQAMTEFIIVFPVLFLLFLVIIQTALLMTARQVVEYSAFYAARSAIVYFPEKLVKRAAAIACISIVPPMTSETFTALHDFAVGLGDTVIDTSALAEAYPEYPELGNLDLSRARIPGMEIIEKLRNSNYSDILPSRHSYLAEGLKNIGDMCGEGEKGLLRYATAALLNDLDIEVSNYSISIPAVDARVELTHHYVLRVPMVNKLFFYMYIYGSLKDKIKDRLSDFYPDLPQGAINEITGTALNSVMSLANASPNGSMYLIPIKASATLTME